MERKQYADYGKVVSVGEALKASLFRREDGFYAYRDGLNDQILADRLSVSTSTIRTVRTQMFGKVKSWTQRKQAAKADPMATLEAKVDAIAESLLVVVKAIKAPSERGPRVEKKVDEALEILRKLL